MLYEIYLWDSWKNEWVVEERGKSLNPEEAIEYYNSLRKTWGNRSTKLVQVIEEHEYVYKPKARL